MIRYGAALLACLWAGAVWAQDVTGLTGLARVDAARTALTESRKGAELELGLSQAVPYSAYTLDGPPRLVLDFSLVDWGGFDLEALTEARSVTEAVAGTVRPNWSRLVLALAEPLVIETAEMRTSGDVALNLRLVKATPEEFAARSGAPGGAAFTLPEPAQTLAPRPPGHGEGRLMVVLDPGHGGLDPGAIRGDAVEKELMLLFARELREVLLRAGGFDVMLTRDDDIFVPLEMRQTIARMAQADVFISLHADALLEGHARGATVYTLAPEATDAASEKLAERHDRADILAGVDLSDQDDTVAHVLMDLARTETMPRTAALADAIVDGLRANIGDMHKRPNLGAAFSVLKSPDIPSVLIELGFISDSRDLANLQSPEWRARAAVGIRDALRAWAAQDAARAELLRQ